jgi:autoinducer 2-degrading protein
MHVTLVHVHVQSEYVDDFIRATKANHEASITEPGNLRFDVLQQADDRTHFVLYEAYASEQDAAAHKSTQHYQNWRDEVSEWMAEPRRGIRFDGLFPAGSQR